MTAVVPRPVTPNRLDLPPIPADPGGYDGPLPSDTEGFERMSQTLARARVAIQPEYQRHPDDVVVLMLRAKALNIPLGIAVDHLYINPRGRAGLSSQLVRYLLRRAGIEWKLNGTAGFVEALQITRKTVTRTAGGRRRTTTKKYDPVRFEMIEAVNARTVVGGRSVSLAATYHWRTWPIQCMEARLINRMANQHFSDVTLGMSYTAEELNDGTAAAAAETTAASDDTSTVRAEVEEYVQQALSNDATPELIQSDIMARAKKDKLLGEHAGDGLTLEKRLVEIWDMKVKHRHDQERAIPADRAMAAAGYTGAPPVQPDEAWKALPAGEGTMPLPCGCPPSVLITDEHVEGVCRDVLATR